MNNKFFTFIKPYLSFIDKGLFYRLMFEVLAIINLVLPIFLIYYYVDINVFEAKAIILIAFLIFWVIFAFASWVSFQIFWNRRENIQNTSEDGDELLAIPAISHLIKTLGEWFGTWLCINGLGVILLRIILDKEIVDGYFIYRLVGPSFYRDIYDFFNLSATENLIALVSLIIYCYLIIITTRFLAELLRLFLQS